MAALDLVTAAVNAVYDDGLDDDSPGVLDMPASPPPPMAVPQLITSRSKHSSINSSSESLRSNGSAGEAGHAGGRGNGYAKPPMASHRSDGALLPTVSITPSAERMDRLERASTWANDDVRTRVPVERNAREAELTRIGAGGARAVR